VPGGATPRRISKGPGPKITFYTVYALSSARRCEVPPERVSRDRPVGGMKDRTLATAELHVTYSRPEGSTRREGQTREPPPRLDPRSESQRRDNSMKKAAILSMLLTCPVLACERPQEQRNGRRGQSHDAWVLSGPARSRVSDTYSRRPDATKTGGARAPINPGLPVSEYPGTLVRSDPGPACLESATVSVLCYDDATGFIAYGTEAANLTDKTPSRTFRKGEPPDGTGAPPRCDPTLVTSTQLRLAQTSSGEFAFHTARLPGEAFTFTVTADSHLDENTDPALYRRTLANARADVRTSTWTWATPS